VVEEDKIEVVVEGVEEEPELEILTEKKPDPVVIPNQDKKEDVAVQPAVVKKQAKTEEDAEELEGIETKGAQKRIRTLIRQRKERDEELDKARGALAEANSKLLERDKQLSASLKNSLDSNESNLNASIDSAKKRLRVALDQDDNESIVEAQEQMSKSYGELSRIEERKQAWAKYQAEVDAAPARQQVDNVAPTTPTYDPKAMDWAVRNDWFNKDQILTTAALTVNQELINEGDFDPSDDEFYNALDARLAEKYPERFGASLEEEEVVKPVRKPTLQAKQTVAGASRTAASPPGAGSASKNRVHLTQEDVAHAQKWGIPLEEYAREKQRVEASDGEYTTIQI
jgi:hypothetical protein